MQQHGTNDSPPANPQGGMTPKHALIALLATFAALGMFQSYLDAFGIPEPRSLQVGSTVLLSLLTFAWFWLDSESRAYKRSPFLSVSIVALGALAVPYYLLRSRPKGQRLKAVGKCIGFFVLLLLAYGLGGLPVVVLTA